jgi:hypothetical protein
MQKFKYLLCIFFIQFLIPSCNQTESPPENPCTISPNQVVNIDPNQIELGMEVSRSLTNRYSITTSDALLDKLFSANQGLTTLKNYLNTEHDLYGSMGYVNYVAHLEQQGKITGTLRQYLTAFKTSLDSKLAEHPSIVQFGSFTSAQIESLTNLNLCPGDLNSAKAFLNTVQGFAQYYYNHHDAHASSGRGCDFWETLGCGVLSVVVGAAVTVGIFVATSNALIMVTDGNGPINPDKQNGQHFLGTLAIAAGVWTATHLYDWCCPEDEEIVLCSKPTGAYVQTHACNDFTYNVVGPGNYITTLWGNINTNPLVATTPTPSLRLSVPDLTNESLINATVGCVDPNGVTTYPWNDKLFFNTNATLSPFSIQWGQNPPPTASTNTTYAISVTSGSQGQYALSWSVSPWGGSVTSTGSWSGNLTFFGSGTKTVTATLTNTCTGQSKSISQLVNVF